jgi:thiol-disulfide isomerase/thioredoxin
MILAIIGILYLVARYRFKNIPAVVDHEDKLTITDKVFQDMTKRKLVLTDFWSNWCGPCRMKAQVINEVTPEFHGNSFVKKQTLNYICHFSKNSR